MKSICVYLGASCGNNKIFSPSVTILGKEIADLGLTLIYGGSSLGLMGLLASTVKESGGKTIGVITKD
jgi:predicted Rossmann-fold nucleotide-binding protein